MRSRSSRRSARNRAYRAKAAYESGAGAAGRCGGGARTPACRSRSGTTRAFAGRAAGLEHHAGRIQEHGRAGARSTSAPATSFRSCCRSASRRPSGCRPSRSTARCGASIRRPFLCYLDFEAFQIVGSSPEILVRVRDGEVTIRPIAGTRPRGATAGRGRAARRGAAGRSEGARRASDAARSRPQRCRPRRRASAPSRSPTASVVERYSHVMHIVSNVEGRLDPRIDALDALRRRLPGRHRLGRAEGARDGDHRRTGDGQARPLRRLRRLFRRRRRDGHLHRAAHGGGEGRAHASSRPAPASSTTPTRRPSSRNASTRPRRCSAPPKRRCASPAAREEGSRRPMSSPASAQRLGKGIQEHRRAWVWIPFPRLRYAPASRG